MTYGSFVKQLNARGMFRIRPDLNQVRKVLRVLGDPQDRYPTIHIAGTNGKGSVAAALESVLRASGYRTGLYTSPHLVDLRERIALNGAPFTHGFTAVAKQVLEAEKRAGGTLTYFEVLTVIAFQSFAEKKVDLAVVECGLGGQWDATNTMKKPLLSLITSIGLDHTEWLGRTEYEIAQQKAGIIKRGGYVISGARGEGRVAIKRQAALQKAELLQIDADFRAVPLTSSWRAQKQVIRFLYKGAKTENVPFGLLGVHQVDNAALALAAIEALKKIGYRISNEKRDLGLRHIHWPGRLQIFRRPGSAPVLLDGAHNPPAMKQLLSSIQASAFQNAPKTFVFSAYKDKDFRAMGEMISPAASEVCLSELPKPRGASLRALRSAFRNVEGPVRELKDAPSALRAALRDTPKEGLVVVTGSLSWVGQILKTLPSWQASPTLHV